jgi:hypothetical protein
MIILRIEHQVQNFLGWKKAFESDPIDRKKSGVLGHRIFQPVDDPNYVIIDLEFEGVQQAEDTLVKLRTLWEKVEGKIMFSPKTQIISLV